MRFEKYFHFVEPKVHTPRQEINIFTGLIAFSPSLSALRLLDQMSVRYVLARRDDLFTGANLTRAGWRIVFRPTKGEYVVYESPTPVPRAYVAHAVRPVDNEESALQAATDSSLDARRTVVLEPGDRPHMPPIGADAPPTQARITRYEPTRVVIETDDPQPGYLVLTDTFYPGCVATVDGDRVEISRANYIFRAGPLPPAPHIVNL